MKQKTELKDYTWKQTDFLDMNGINCIYKGQYKNILKNEQYSCAIKIINKDICQEDIIKQMTEQDIRGIQDLQGPNVVQLKDVIEESNHIYIITKLYKQGNLRDYLHKQGSYMNEQRAIYILNQILNGMKTIKSKNYVHRDLKPEYILIHDNKFDICGFAFSKQVQPNEEMDFYCGSLGYMSPQIIMRVPYTEKSDIWSIGCLFYEMLTGDVPGRGSNDLERIIDIKNNKVQYPYKYKISNTSKAFIDKCLVYEEKDRYTWDEIFLHDYFTNTYSKRDFIYEDKENKEQGSQINEETIQCLKKLQEYFIQQGPYAIKKVFQEFFQKDFINFVQFKQLLSKFNLSEENGRNLFNFFDFQRDGQISVQEFEYRIYQTDYNEQYPNILIQNQIAKGIIKELKILILKNDIKLDRLFELYNQNDDDDVLDPEEFYFLIKKVNKNITQMECLYCFQYFDADQSGSITFQEFKDAIDLEEQPSSQLLYLQEHNGQVLSSTEYAIINNLKNLIQKYKINIDMIFANFDQNVIGALNYEQFYKFIQTFNETANQVSVQQLFKVFQDEKQLLQYENFVVMLN